MTRAKMRCRNIFKWSNNNNEININCWSSNFFISASWNPRQTEFTAREDLSGLSFKMQALISIGSKRQRERECDESFHVSMFASDGSSVLNAVGNWKRELSPVSVCLIFLIVYSMSQPQANELAREMINFPCLQFSF